MTVSALTILITAVVILVLVVGFGWVYKTANRLDRLHVRVDLAWQALDASLARRAVVARTIGSGLGADGRELIAAADRAERADRGGREAAENQVSAHLAQVDTSTLRAQVVAELADADARVMISRRFYNDAVRDTLALRERRPVRWLQLGGTAETPRYLEIAERVVIWVIAGVNRVKRLGPAQVSRCRGPRIEPTPGVVWPRSGRAAENHSK